MLIRKLFKAEMAHNVPGAYTKRCHYLHGHSYKFEIFLRSPQPNSASMVADFKGIKEMGINDFFDSFDHSVMVWKKDKASNFILHINPERHIVVPMIPTAEMMAKSFFVICEAILATGPNLSGEKDVVVDHVVVHETATGSASYGIEDKVNDKFPDPKFSEWIISEGIRKDWKRKDWYEKAKNYLSHAKKYTVPSLS